MQPKCVLCGSRKFRLIKEIRSGKENFFLYQCGNNHVLALDALVHNTENPMETVG